MTSIAHPSSTQATDQSAIGNWQLKMLFVLVNVNVFSVDHIILACAPRRRSSGR
jgi:hypothetical protein